MLCRPLLGGLSNSVCPPAVVWGRCSVRVHSSPGPAIFSCQHRARAHGRRRVRPVRGAEEAASTFAPSDSTTITDAAVLGSAASSSAEENGSRREGSVLPNAEEAPTAGVEAVSSGMNTPDLEQLQAQQELQQTAVSEKTGEPASCFWPYVQMKTTVNTAAGQVDLETLQCCSPSYCPAACACNIQPPQEPCCACCRC